MDKVVYVCTGTCKAEISEEKYLAGLTKCGTKECTMFGKPFKKMAKCDVCGQLYSGSSKHNH